MQQPSILLVFNNYLPCVRMCAAIGVDAIPSLLFTPANTNAFTQLQPQPIKTSIWHHQYTSWQHQHTLREHSLPHFYSNHAGDPTAKIPVLPDYLTAELPIRAARRARLRFRRTRFAYNMQRVGFRISPTCTHCNMNKHETNHHVLCECPAYENARQVCVNDITTLVPAPFLMSFLTSDSLISPTPACETAGVSHLLANILAISSTFFQSIAAVRIF